MNLINKKLFILGFPVFINRKIYFPKNWLKGNLNFQLNIKNI